MTKTPKKTAAAIEPMTAATESAVVTTAAASSADSAPVDATNPPADWPPMDPDRLGGPNNPLTDADAAADLAGTPRPSRADGKAKGSRKTDENTDGITDTLLMRIALAHPDAKEPVYATDGSGCFDLFTPTAAHLNAGQAVTIDLGLVVEVPEGWMMDIFSRSGHGFEHDVVLANAVGQIDSDYRGTIKVKLRSHGATHLQINAGNRIAQARLVPVPRVRFEVVDVKDLSVTERGQGGLGSTGA